MGPRCRARKPDIHGRADLWWLRRRPGVLQVSLPPCLHHHLWSIAWCLLVNIGSVFFRSVSGNSILDHITYLGVSMHAEAWSSCRIVMEYTELQHKMDLYGNVVLSKQPDLHSAQWIHVKISCTIGVAPRSLCFVVSAFRKGDDTFTGRCLL
jgi:hypothetical protein